MTSTRVIRAALALLLTAAVGGVAAEPGPAYSDHVHLLVYRDAAGAEHPVRNSADWARRRAHILDAMRQVMGPLPASDAIVPLEPHVDEETATDRYVRRKLTIAIGGGDRLPVYLFLPKGGAGKLPAIVCLHPTSRQIGKGTVSGLGGDANAAYAVELAERGYVTLAPDYVNMGEYRFDPYAHGFVSATMKGIWNHMRCVDYLRSLPQVDGERIGAIGHSLGGHNSMFLGVFDERIKCVVSSCGFCSFPTYMKGNLAGWSHDGYMPRIRTVYGCDPARMPFDFTEVVAALAPRPFLACAPLRDTNFDVQGVRDCLAAAEPAYALLGVKDRLRGIFPDAGHEFPPAARQTAYEWLDRWLKPH
ncbi:MAG TPA: prolyl oligopeptidase family serine peptidase [Gemmataceae bacterium]|nr:prolyl oligopeptidase family serine peptidase [Gemmataceae bacterium]